MKHHVNFFILLFLSISVLYAQEKGPQRFEKEISTYEAQDQNDFPPKGANLLVGSSSFRIWKDVNNYFPGYTIINRGFGGSNYADLLYYLDRIVIPYAPAKIFIYEGDNDIASGRDTKTIMKDVKKIRKIIKKKLPETEVAILAAKPSVARWNLKDKYMELNDALELFACQNEMTEYVNVWYPALDDDGNVLTNIFREDNLHMNAEGYKIWQKVLAPYLVK
ncbi:MAG: GDSL-type esterase/lipase family protein [Bacteroidota bacterium]